VIVEARAPGAKKPRRFHDIPGLLRKRRRERVTRPRGVAPKPDSKPNPPAGR
jgi:hypothetical protein